MNINKSIDIDFGKAEEQAIKALLEQHFGPLEPTNTYNHFDFKNEKFVIEVKTRRIRHNRYDTQIFGTNKLMTGRKYLKKGIQPVFVFNCIDGIFVWYLDEAEISHNAIGGRSDRGKVEQHKQTHISVRYLKELNMLPLSRNE